MKDKLHTPHVHISEIRLTVQRRQLKHRNVVKYGSISTAEDRKKQLQEVFLLHGFRNPSAKPLHEVFWSQPMH